MLEIAKTTGRISELKERTGIVLGNAGIDFTLPKSRENTVRLVFAGQYSAGKSSIIKMLTGRNDIAIGAGITTQQTHTYEWNGLEIVDTPGIHTQLRPDHDEISYEAIASADMLVFVVTNELFGAHIAEHFRKLAIDRDKAGEMILVVNKMGRTAGGNTPSQREVIAEDLKKVIAPYTPEQMYISFLDAKAYLEGVQVRNEDPEYAGELFEESGYEAFVENLNRFVQEKKIPAKLTTELYHIDDCLERYIRELEPRSGDSDFDALEESFLQQRHLLIETRGSIQQEVKNIYSTAASRIRELGLNAANLIDEGCSREEVETGLQSCICQATEEMDRCQEEAGNVINGRLSEMGQQMEEMENSEFSMELKARLSGKYDGMPEGVRNIISQAGSGFQDVGRAVAGKACRAGVEGGLKLTNCSGSTVHQIVLKAGNLLNFKFKPWQAVKIARGIAIGGQVLNVLGIGLSVFMQMREDQEEARIREEMRRDRISIRSQFSSAARELEDYGRQVLRENVDRTFEDSIAVVDAGIREIRETREDRSAACRQLEELLLECRNLIREIHSDPA